MQNIPQCQLDVCILWFGVYGLWFGVYGLGSMIYALFPSMVTCKGRGGVERMRGKDHHKLRHVARHTPHVTRHTSPFAR